MARRKYGKAEGKRIGQIWKESQHRERDAQGVSVSMYGEDRGTKEALQHRDVSLTTDPTGATGRSVARVEDLLDRWLRGGQINKSEYEIGRLFEREFQRSGLDGLKASAMDAVGSPGGGSGDHYIEVLSSANRNVRIMLQRIGGRESESARAFISILGFGCSLRDIEARSKKHKQYWAGCLKSGLQMLAHQQHRKNTP